MKKKELLKLITELQEKVALLETQINLMSTRQYPGIITVPSIWTTPVITCQHEYPEGAYGSTIPPACKKCGQQFPGYTVTCTTTSGGTQPTPPELAEYIARNTRN